MAAEDATPQLPQVNRRLATPGRRLGGISGFLGGVMAALGLIALLALMLVDGGFHDTQARLRLLTVVPIVMFGPPGVGVLVGLGVAKAVARLCSAPAEWNDTTCIFAFLGGFLLGGVTAFFLSVVVLISLADDPWKNG